MLGTVIAQFTYVDSKHMIYKTILCRYNIYFQCFIMSISHFIHL